MVATTRVDERWLVWWCLTLWRGNKGSKGESGWFRNGRGQAHKQALEGGGNWESKQASGREGCAATLAKLETSREEEHKTAALGGEGRRGGLRWAVGGRREGAQAERAASAAARLAPSSRQRRPSRRVPLWQHASTPPLTKESRKSALGENQRGLRQGPRPALRVRARRHGAATPLRTRAGRAASARRCTAGARSAGAAQRQGARTASKAGCLLVDDRHAAAARGRARGRAAAAAHALQVDLKNWNSRPSCSRDGGKGCDARVR